MVDVCNYSLTYSLTGHINHMSPDDHYQNLKRVIAAKRDCILNTRIMGVEGDNIVYAHAHQLLKSKGAV